MTFAASMTPSTICLYPVQRQTLRFFWNQSRTSSRVGFTFCWRSAYAETTKPGVQNPHWIPPEFMIAAWIGWRFVGVPMPSMVVIRLYSSIVRIVRMQGRMTLPFRTMVHEPQTPVSQPTFVPVSPIRRSTSDSVSLSGSQMSMRSAPLTFSHIFLSCMTPSLSGWTGWHRLLTVSSDATDMAFVLPGSFTVRRPSSKSTSGDLRPGARRRHT